MSLVNDLDIPTSEDARLYNYVGGLLQWLMHGRYDEEHRVHACDPCWTNTLLYFKYMVTKL